MKFRILTLAVSLCVITFGFYLAWLAFSILEPTKFNGAGIVLLTISSIGVMIWFFLIAIKRLSFRRKPEDLQKYRVEHKIGARTLRNPKKT